MSTPSPPRPTSPTVTGSPVEIAAGVHVISDRGVSMVPNVGIVVGTRAVLVVDTGIGAANGLYVLEQAKQLAKGLPIYLTVTQMDPGHAFGSQAFKGTGTIVYSQQQERRRTERASSYADYFATLGPHVDAALRGLELVEPDIVFDDRWTVDLGGMSVVLQNWGPSHTADDQTVLVDHDVLFAGDLLQKGAFPILPYFAPFDSHFDSNRWIAALDAAIAANPLIIVPGHGPMATVADAGDVRDYLVWVRTEVARLNTRDERTDGARALIQQRTRERWSTWHSEQWIAYLITACLAERSNQ